MPICLHENSLRPRAGPKMHLFSALQAGKKVITPTNSDQKLFRTLLLWHGVHTLNCCGSGESEIELSFC